MNKWIKIIIAVTVIAMVAFIAWTLRPSAPTPEYKTNEARIKSITRMVELCTSDIHDEMAIKAHINGKWIVARQTVEGLIRFDLDSLRIEQRGDTTLVYLPRERVDILENAEPGAYEVLDAWDARNSVFSRTMTAAEENAIKSKWQEESRKRVYKRGYVRQARKNAIATLTPLLNAMKGTDDKNAPVIIIDPTPDPRP